MKSILRQLAKYDEPIVPKGVVVETPSVVDPVLLAIERILNYPTISANDFKKKASETYALLKNYKPSNLSGVLFPLTLDIAYYLYYYHHIQISSEEIIDNELFQFLQKTDRISYMNKLFKSMDDTSKKIFLARILIGSSTRKSNASNKLDSLPQEYQSLTALRLGCFANLKAACDILERLSKSASVEQIILGRIGYIAFWYWANSCIQEGIEIIELKCLPFTSVPR